VVEDQLAALGGRPVRNKSFPKWPIYDSEEEKQLLSVLRSSFFKGFLDRALRRPGKIQEFERAFASYHEAPHGMAVTNGTQAIEVCLLAAGIRPSDEVIVPSYTAISTASAVAMVGAIPIFADIDPDTLNVTPDSVRSVLTEMTRAVIPVHYSGRFAPMDGLSDLARNHGLLLIEDAAHAHGARYKGRYAGSWSQAATFSFQESKNMSAGEGGIILTHNPAFAEACWERINMGRRPGQPWYQHYSLSSNYRMTVWQAAILLAQLKRLKNQVHRRDKNGRYLDKLLATIPGIIPGRRDPNQDINPHHLYTFRLDPNHFAVPKELFIYALQAEGIPAYPGISLPLYRTEAFREKTLPLGRGTPTYGKMHHPGTETACAQTVWLEQNVLLCERKDVEDVAAAIGKVAADPNILQRVVPDQGFKNFVKQGLKTIRDRVRA
jgi:dTDP-4-amino-4,6-dideoxygalactose transaminase